MTLGIEYQELIRIRKDIGNLSLSPERRVELGQMVETGLTEEFDKLLSNPSEISKFLTSIRSSLEQSEKRKPSALRLAAASVKNYLSLRLELKSPYILDQGWAGEVLFAGLFDADLAANSLSTMLILAEDHLGGWDSANITEALRCIPSGQSNNPRAIALHADTYRYLAVQAHKYSALLKDDNTAALAIREYRREVALTPNMFYPGEIKECSLAGVNVAEYAFRRFILEASN